MASGFSRFVSSVKDALGLGPVASGHMVVDEMSAAEEARLDNFKARFSQTDLGAALLGFAADNDITIKYSHNMPPQERGLFAGMKTLMLNPNFTDDQLMDVLAHELRHGWQNRQPGLDGMNKGNMPPEAAVAYNRFIEADAFAFGQKFVEDFAAKTGDHGPLMAFWQGRTPELPDNSPGADAKRFFAWNQRLQEGGAYDLTEMQSQWQAQSFRAQYGAQAVPGKMNAPSSVDALILDVARKTDGTWPFTGSAENGGHYLSHIADSTITAPEVIAVRPDFQPSMKSLAETYKAQFDVVQAGAATPAAKITAPSSKI